jgi:hypothetical protein
LYHQLKALLTYISEDKQAPDTLPRMGGEQSDPVWL